MALSSKTIVILVCCGVSAVVTGCTYSGWSYAPLEQPLVRDTWSLSFDIPNLADCGPTPADTYIDLSDRSFVYEVTLREKDTTSNPRIICRLDSVLVVFPGDIQSIPLVQSSEIERETHVGATSVQHTACFGSFQVPKSRPDTIRIEQSVTIVDRDSRQETTRFHYTIRAVLRRHRYWVLRELIRG
jgi:hypothetical protein